jgi:HNH endonuclease
MNWEAFFTYDPATGELRWLVDRPFGSARAGDLAGGPGHHGYLTVGVEGRRYYVHRIAWKMMNGPIPATHCIDHIDGDRSNNRLANLRLATLTDNQRNARLPRNNRSGLPGVHHRRGAFEVYCGTEYLGRFDNFFEACCARKSAEREHGFHENHGRKE